MSIFLSPADGVARLGQQEISIRLYGADGCLLVGEDCSACLRPLTFAERSRLVDYAARTSSPERAVAKMVLEAALVKPETKTVGNKQTSKLPAEHVDEIVLSILALVLAGADDESLPSFAESVHVVGQVSNWGPEQLSQLSAQDVDRLAKQYLADAGSNDDDGWTRLQFQSKYDDELDAIERRLTNNLLTRLRSDSDIASDVSEAAPDLREASNNALAEPVFLPEDGSKVTSEPGQDTIDTDHGSPISSSINAPVSGNGQGRVLGRTSSGQHSAALATPVESAKKGYQAVPPEVDQTKPSSASTGSPPNPLANSTKRHQSSVPTIRSSEATQSGTHSAGQITNQSSDKTLPQDVTQQRRVLPSSVQPPIPQHRSGELSDKTIDSRDSAFPRPIHHASANAPSAANFQLSRPSTASVTESAVSSQPQSMQVKHLVDELACLLHLEGDLRGIDR